MYSVFVAKSIDDESGQPRKFTTFAEAFKVFNTELRALLKQGCSQMIFEVGCWIEYVGPLDGRPVRACALTYDAADIAFEFGIITEDEKIVEPPPSVDEAAIQRLMANRTARGMIQDSTEHTQVVKVNLESTREKLSRLGETGGVAVVDELIEQVDDTMADLNARAQQLDDQLPTLIPSAKPSPTAEANS